MKVIDFISIIIMFPAMSYGSFALYFLTTGAVYVLFRRMSFREYKETMRKELRLGESFLNSSRKFFGFTYSPLFLIVIMFRLVLPLEEEKYSGYIFYSIVGYLLLLLFSGYVFPKETKAEKNFEIICKEISSIIDGYQEAYPENCFVDYQYFINDALDEYENTGRRMYKHFVDVVECKKAAHVLLLSTLYDFLISGEWKWSEGSRKCSCDFFAYVAKISLQSNYVNKQIITQYVTEIKKQK